jgi:hypothetical protein
VNLPAVSTAEVVDGPSGRRVRVRFDSGLSLTLSLEDAAQAASDPTAAAAFLRRAATTKGYRS